MKKPTLTSTQIINMSMGFLGIQAGFALQNGNASRILQTYGANVEHLSWFWLVAPLSGMIVQPIIGYYSDRTWNKLGRRKPYFLTGALLAALGLIFLPNASAAIAIMPAIVLGAGVLMMMDASFNVAMEPFRALVADNTPEHQHTRGFSVQTVLIGIGAVIGSWMPYVFAEWLGIAKIAPAGEVPDNVIYSFYVGALFFLGAILWTISTTKEYSPEERKSFGEIEEHQETSGLSQIFKDFKNMPATMRNLGGVQFFAWFSLFTMWTYTTAAIAHHIYGVPIGDSASVAYNDAGNWVGIIFGVYNAVSAVFALFLPRIAAKYGKKQTHAFALFCGALGLISMYFVSSPTWLIASMLGVGIAWASILAMPYAILANSIPAQKMGIYMGIFNFFITLPQIVSAIFSGPILEYCFGKNAIYSIIMAGVFMAIAGVLALRIKE